MHRLINLRSALALAATGSLLALSAPSAAQNAQQLYIKSLAATCANCHGTDGKAAEGSSAVTLAGLPQGYIVAQMQAFKAGTRPATIMHQISKGYSDAQVAQIASYFATLKK